MKAGNSQAMDKAKEVDVDDLAVGVLRCVRRLLELLERCVRTEAMQRKDVSTNTPGNETDSTAKAAPKDSKTEEKAGDKSGVEGELRDVLQVMVGTLRRIVDDLKNEDKERASPLPSIFDISVTSSEKTITVPDNTPDEPNEESASNNNDNVHDEQIMLPVNKYESTDQDEGIRKDKEEVSIPSWNSDEEFLEDGKAEDYDRNVQDWYKETEDEILNGKNIEEVTVGDDNDKEEPLWDEDEPQGDEKAKEDDGEKSCEEPGGDSIVLEEEEPAQQMDGEPLSVEGSGDHPTLIEEIDPPEVGGQLEKSIVHEDEGDGAAAGVVDMPVADVENQADENWKPEVCGRAQSVCAPAADNPEDEDTADECVHKDDFEPSDMEYDSFFPTEDEDFLPKAEAPREEDTPEVLGLPAVRMFRKHMETNNVEVEMFPTTHNQPKRHYFYTCRVLGLEAEACGRSKRAAKRNAISKIIRLIIKKQKDGSLPKAVSPFTNDELASLVEVCRGGADYLSRLRQLCRSLQAPEPTYDVQISEDGAGDKVFTVQCSALGRTAVGICAKKRSAKRHAAREIVKRYEEEAAAVRTPVTA